MPIEFVLFGCVLAGVALFHRRAMHVALAGALAIALFKIVASPFDTGPGIGGFVRHLGLEWVVLTNLLLLLLGFALLARHFEDSRIPAMLPQWLPDDWKGGFVLLLLVFALSGLLDNIAATMIGGAVAHTVFRQRVHIGYLAAIVAAANAGGAGSVLGDTTTTMMWIAGVSPLAVLEAYIAAGAALVIFGVPAAMQQQAYSPIQRDPPQAIRIDPARVAVVAIILVSALVANVVVNTQFSVSAHAFPFLGAAVWLAILVTAAVRTPQWSLLPGALQGSVFLLSLVFCASMMPVERLPPPSWPATLGLGLLSAVFDNIPLTALAIKQGGYDWGFLAYAVGFGGSMIWFGSSAGVALSNMYPEARSVGLWLRHGWYVALAYVAGFFVLLGTLGYNP